MKFSRGTEFVKTENLMGLRAHPLIAIAAVSIMVLSVIAVAMLTGVLPKERSSRHDAVRADSIANPQSVTCALCGTIEAIRIVEVVDEGAGPASEGGSTALLASGGRAASGSEIAKGATKRHVHRVTVRMDDGSYRTVSMSDAPALAVGDKVRVVEGKLVRS